MLKSKQVKVTIDTGLADAFKAHCTTKGVSMAAKIAGLMRSEIGSAQAPAQGQLPLATRRQRRQAAQRCAKEVERIRDAEDAYRTRIPKNLTGGDAYGAAEDAVDTLEQATELLREAF
jgi:hypothetical protein